MKRLLVICLAAATLSNCGGNGSQTIILADALTDPFNRSLPIAPSAFVELNLVMPQGTTSSATFMATGELAWNTHSHPNGELVMHSEGTSASGTLELTSTDDSIYSYLWRNETDDTITFEVAVTNSSGVEFDSWVP